jgi:hypothetical protein
MYVYVNKRGNWLDMAGIELSALGCQCLSNRRIPDLEALQSLLVPWCTDRNERQKGVDWQFTTSDAKIKLARLYPILNF